MPKHNSRTSPIKVKPENRLQILSDEEIDQIHQATLTVLKETGVQFPSKKALQIFVDAGADVDFEKEIVKTPSALVTEALETALSPSNCPITKPTIWQFEPFTASLLAPCFIG